MVEFRKRFSNFMISIILFYNLAVKNKFLLLKSSPLDVCNYCICMYLFEK